MPDPAAAPTEAAEESAPPASENPPADPTEEKTPKWDGDFDPDRAAKLVANLRSDLETAKNELKATREQLGEKEEAEKTEFQRIQDRATAAEQEANNAKLELMRLRVAKEHSLPDDLMEFLTGDSEEDLAAKAQRLAEYAAGPAAEVPGRPKPRLRPGTGEDPSTGSAADFDPAAIAAKARDY